MLIANKHTQRTNASLLLVFTESTRQRAYSLVAQAYTSITAEDFAAFVGYSVEEAVKGMNVSTGCDRVNLFTVVGGLTPPCFSFLPPKGVVSQGWQADPATRMVMPKKPGRWQCRAVKYLEFRPPPLCSPLSVLMDESKCGGS